MKKLRLGSMFGGLSLILVLSACGNSKVPQPQQNAQGMQGLPRADPQLVRAVTSAEAQDDFLDALNFLPVDVRAKATLVDMEDAKAYGTSPIVEGAGTLFFRNYKSNTFSLKI